MQAQVQATEATDQKAAAKRRKRFVFVLVVQVVIFVTSVVLITQISGSTGLGAWSRTLARLHLGHIAVMTFSITTLAWRVEKKLSVLLSCSMTPVYLMAVCDSVWDCRIFHQLVEMLVLLVCVLIITVMRKLIGRLQGNSKNVHVSRVTRVQAAFLLVAVPVFAVDMVVVGGLALQVARTACWGFIMCNGWLHFATYILGVDAAFKTALSGSPRIVSVRSLKDAGKLRRAKKNLKRNMILCFVSVTMGSTYFMWWPQAGDRYYCKPRELGGGVQAIFTRVALMICGLFNHLSVVHTTFVFKKKNPKTACTKKRIASNATAGYGNVSATGSYANKTCNETNQHISAGSGQQ